MLAGPDQTRRPGLAILANVPTPYRMHLHRRIVREIPEMQLHSLFTHGHTQFRWQFEMPPELNAVRFGAPGQDTRCSPIRYAWTDLRKARRIVRYLDEHDVRAVVIPGYSDLTRIALLRSCRRRANRFSYLRADSNIHGDIDPNSLRGRVKRVLVRWAIRQVDAVMPMGQFGREYFEQYGARRFYYVPYEPDCSIFQQVDTDALARFQSDRGLKPGRRRILYSGRLVNLKRVDLLINAFAKIAEQRPDWDVVIVGDGPERGQLEQSVPESLRDRYHWLGFCEMDQLPLAYRSCDLLVHPSEYEPWALVIHEAMAAGLPVIASHVVGAAKEMVEPGINGDIFPSGNLEELTSKLAVATEPNTLTEYQQNIPAVMDRYHERLDPVRGLRSALTDAGLLGSAEPQPTEGST